METNKKKILIVLTRLPFPETDGTRQRMMDLIKGISNDFSLDLLVVGDEKMSAEVKQVLDGFFENIFIFSFSKLSLYFKALRSFVSGKPLQVEYYFDQQVFNFIQSRRDNYQVVYLHTIRMGRYLEKLRLSDRDKVFLDLNDAISLNYHTAKDLARFPWNLIYSFEEQRVKAYELKLLSLVKHVNVVSAYDENYLKSGCITQNITCPKFYRILPGVKPHEKVAFSAQESKKIVFFGNIKYPPNKDAVLYFIDKIFPSIRARIQGVVFVIAGSGSESLNLANLEGVETMGFVDNLCDLFTDACLVVAPIRFGAGVPTKILEALSYGVPIVTTPVGVRGLDIKGRTEDSGIFCVDLVDVQGWVAAVENLINNKQLRESVGGAGFDFIKNKYHQNITRERYLSAMQEIVKN